MKKRLLCTVLFIAVVLCLGFAACDRASDEPSLTVELNKNELRLTVGQSETLVATISVEGLSVSWSSTDDAVATVSKGNVQAVGKGSADIVAKVGTVQAVCKVTVTEEKPTIEPTISVEEGYESLIVFYGNQPTDEELLAGLSATDAEGATLTVVMTNNGDIDADKLGEYTISYRAEDANGLSTTLTRKAYVTYFGITAEDLDGKSVSALNNWSYTLVGEARTADEWAQNVVPGHSSNWNRFEGPVENYIVMHGSDINGREAITDEKDDELPNTILWNKLIVPADCTIFRVYCSNNPYPDYNNLLSKVRVSVYDIATKTFAVADNYREIKAPLNASKEGLDYDYIRNRSYQDFDLTAYVGKQIIVFVEQDASANVYQEEYYSDIGYLEFQIPTMITETRDTLVVYSMGFVKGEEKIDYSSLVLDDLTSWGADDTSDYTRWGLRGDEVAKGKWTVKFLNGATGALNNVTGLGGSLQLIAREPADGRDGNVILRDAVLMNKVAVGNNKYFVVYVGTDSDALNVNYRLTFVTEDGTEHHLTPKFNVNGYTPVYDGWATVQKSQWVEGVKLIYDVSEFVEKTVVVLIEQDENVEAGEGNCTLWFNKAAFIADMEFAPADYTAYNRLKNEVEQANYNQDDYTEMSWNIFVEALSKFEAVADDLVNEQQNDIDVAVANLTDAIELLTSKPEPVIPPEDTTHGELAEELMDFTTDAWLAMPVDARGVWGTDASKGEYWGLRGDTGAKAAWKWYVVNSGTLYHAADLKSSLQSVAYECGNDKDGKFGADAMFVNKVWVRGNYLRIYVGCDDANGSVNMRVRLIKDDGTITVLSAVKTVEGEATAVADGWYTIKVGQWIYGTALVYDMSDYLDGIVTVVVEQDQNETAEGTTCTMWLNKVEFVPLANYSEYNELKQQIIAANYTAEEYTEESYANFATEWQKFNSLSLKLSVEEQSVVDEAVAHMRTAVEGLTKPAEPTLQQEFCGFDNAQWKSMKTDGSASWGTDSEDANAWGLRGDAEAAAKWKIYGNSLEGFPVPILDLAANENAVSDGVADAVLVNKINVGNASKISFWLGTEWGNGANVKVSVVTADGTVHDLAVVSSEVGYEQSSNGWGKVTASQWVYGTKIGYDLSEYVGQEVTVVLQLDRVDTGRSTLWFVKAALE